MNNTDASQPIVVVDYDPEWPRLYEEERARIIALIGDSLEELHHVGSTSVPGIAAKPIIDILLVVPDIQLAERCVEPLQHLDYAYFGEAGIPGRHYFRKPADVSMRQHTHHLHMLERKHDEYAYMLHFRDYLRTHSEAARDYQCLKKELAIKYRHDRVAYTDAKESMVKSILRVYEKESVNERE